MTVVEVSPKKLPPAAEDRRSAALERVGARVLREAAEVQAVPGKAFISHVADRMDMPVRDLAPVLVRLHRRGLLELVRTDVTRAFDPDDVAASEIGYLESRYHMVRVATKNPAMPPEIEEAVEKYREFQRLEPQEIGRFHKGFVIPRRVRRLGPAKNVLYQSGKVDPETGKLPRKPVNYIHEHDAGVVVYDQTGSRRSLEVAVPSFIAGARALVLLGDCMGFEFEDGNGELRSAHVRQPFPELYCTPCGRALIVVEKKIEVFAMMWGGALGVEGRGIVG